LRTLAGVLDGALPIIAAGGIMSSDEAVERIKAGATLVQLYTGLVYKGFGLVGKIKSGLRKRLSQHGYNSILDAVGTEAR